MRIALTGNPISGKTTMFNALMVAQEAFGLAHLTDDGCVMAQKYAFCYVVIERKITELCGNGAASENAICGMLADMPPETINNLYDSRSI